MIQSKKNDSNLYTMNELLKKAIEGIDKQFKNSERITGILTGLADFDCMTNGLQPGNLIAITSHSYVLNSAFMINIVENIAIDSDVGVVVFSVEMSAESMTLQMISTLGRINHSRICSGQLKENDWSRLTSAVSILNEANIFIDESIKLSINDLCSRVYDLKLKNKVGLIVIDNIERMSVNENIDISIALKDLAKEMNVPVIVLSQLTNDFEYRQNKRAALSDLMGTRTFYSNADLIVFVNSDDACNKNSLNEGIAEINIIKNVNGLLGMTKVAYLKEYEKFENLVVSEI